MGVCACDKTGILSNKLVPVGIMIRTILVTLFFLGISQANDCFDICKFCYIGSESRDSLSYAMESTRVTNFHGIMQCANSLSKSTMGMALDNSQEKFNHQCILIDNLDFCVQLWKQKYDVDCEVPIKNMVKRNFQVSHTFWKPNKNDTNWLSHRVHRIDLIVSMNTFMVLTTQTLKILH